MSVVFQRQFILNTILFRNVKTFHFYYDNQIIQFPSPKEEEQQEEEQQEEDEEEEEQQEEEEEEQEEEQQQE